MEVLMLQVLWRVRRTSTVITCSCSKEQIPHQAQGTPHSPKFKLQLQPLQEASTLDPRHTALSSLSPSSYLLPQLLPLAQLSWRLSHPSPAYPNSSSCT